MTRCNVTAASHTMASHDEMCEGKQGQDAAQQCNNQLHKAGEMRCARGLDSMMRQDKTRQQEDEMTCCDNET